MSPFQAFSVISFPLYSLLRLAIIVSTSASWAGIS